MKDLFWEHYPLPDDIRENIKKNGLFILDTNVLLNLYRYPNQTRDEWLRVLGAVKDRVWIPHQVALEFHRHRLERFNERPLARRRVFETLTKEASRTTEHLLKDVTFHPSEQKRELSARIESAFDSIRDFLEGLKENEPDEDPTDPLRSDTVLTAVTAIFDGRTGQPFDTATMDTLKRDAEERYKQKVPPGYLDSAKSSTDLQIGDFLLWRQIIDHVAEVSRPFLLVTNEAKEDWWLLSGSNKLGPRVELRRELFDEAGVHFDLLTPERFLTYVKEDLGEDVREDTIAATAALSQLDVHGVLLQRSMILPNRRRRLEVLVEIENTWNDRRLRITTDINNVIRSLGEDVAKNEVEVPLFFALINVKYGPLKVPDTNVRLRERPIDSLHDCIRGHSFQDHANAAWIAQAMTRVHRQFSATPKEIGRALAGEDETEVIIDLAVWFFSLDNEF